LNWQVILTSAFFSTVISGIFLLISSSQNRSAQRQETLFRLSFQLAKERTDLGLEMAKRTNTPSAFRDNVFLAEEYYKWLKHFYKTGELPEEAHQKEKKSKRH